MNVTNGAPPDYGDVGVADKPVYVIESAAEIAEPLPPLVWLCQGLRIARGSLTIIGGYGYSRKTLYAQAVGLAIAAGKSALGVFGTVQVPVVHLDYEQGKRITRERYQRMARASGLDLKRALLSTITFPRFKLTDAIAEEAIMQILEETQAGLLIIDSLRASVSGVDENSSEIREYLDLVGRAVKRVDAAAIFLHHVRKPGEGKAVGKYSLRGNSAIFDAGDGIFIFTGEKGEPTRVEHEKDRLIGTELEDFGIDSVDVTSESDPRWGLRVVHLEGEQMRESTAAKDEASEAVARAERTAKIREYLTSLPEQTWRGSRSDLARQLGGRHATTMAVLGDLASTQRVVETKKGRGAEAIRWVGP